MKCCACGLKKGKRHCPAKEESICSQCCGQKRVIEIDCPESCEYLKQGQERDAGEFNKMLRGMDAVALERSKRVLTGSADLLMRLEYALARQRVISRAVVDRDVAQAVDILTATYKTEENGILYENTSDDMRVESVRRELRGIIESLRNPRKGRREGIVDPASDTGDERLTPAAAIECLEFMKSVIAFFQKERDSATAYVDYLARYYPREKSKGSIIIP
ncbi:MAG TPA: hypothetical protein VLL97_12590 [Acidobacteriota bacterium]|nr:hypothetical protein [Acidobacteriota bacterium]